MMEVPQEIYERLEKYITSDIDLAFMPWYVSVRNITISPDGDYFVAGKLIGDDKSQRLYIVEDWFGKFAASN